METRTLFLTNILETHPFLEKFHNSTDGEFNFAIHSAQIETPHFFDLRNPKKLKELLNEETAVIFYLEGNLAINVISEFLKNFENKERKIITIFSALDLFYPAESSNFKTFARISELLRQTAKNHLSVVVFLDENRFKKSFEKEEIKYLGENSPFYEVVLQYGELITEINSLTDATSEHLIYLVKENFEEKAGKIVSNFSSFGSFFFNLSGALKFHNSFFRELKALRKFYEKFPSLKEEGVVKLVTNEPLVEFSPHL